MTQGAFVQGSVSQGGLYVQAEGSFMTVTTNVVLGWDHSGENVDGFNIYVRLPSDPPGEPVLTVGSSVRTVNGTDLGLTAGEVLVLISAFNAAGESAVAELSINVVTAPPVAPDNFRVISQ